MKRQEVLIRLFTHSYFMTMIDASLRSQLLALARQSVSKAFEKPDFHVIRAVGLLDYLEEQQNGLTELSRDWYAIHFPELVSIVEDPDLFFKAVSQITDRQHFSISNLQSLGYSSTLSQEVLNASKNSLGVNVSEGELAAYRQMAQNALSLRAQRLTLERFIEQTLQSLAPNTLELAGAIITARLIAKAGSLESLAKRPASTLQLLGAEKALFRHLRTNRQARPPKYGILMNHGLVKSAPSNRKGAVARSLAAKLALCCRKDFYHPVLDESFVADCLAHVQVVLANVPKKTSRPKRSFGFSATGKPLGGKPYGGKPSFKPRGDFSRKGSTTKFKPGFSKGSNGSRPPMRKKW